MLSFLLRKRKETSTDPFARDSNQPGAEYVFHFPVLRRRRHRSDLPPPAFVDTRGMNFSTAYTAAKLPTCHTLEAGSNLLNLFQ